MLFASIAFPPRLAGAPSAREITDKDAWPMSSSACPKAYLEVLARGIKRGADGS